MAPPNNPPRVGAFIDVMALNYAIKATINDPEVKASLDLYGLRSVLQDLGRNAVRTAYLSPPGQASGVNLGALAAAANAAGFTPHLLRRSQDGRPFVECVIIPEIFAEVPHLDIVVLGVIAPQYCHTIDKLHGFGVDVHVVGPRPRIHADLVEKADRVIDLMMLPDTIRRQDAAFNQEKETP